ncbi:MAG TPA: GGDEF domain-containing phosphodiesterase [Woeseiaceae bacterium]|nr:GGDEF domain-containing phosphodiesterase [Woeseiaceae bacterium]
MSLVTAISGSHAAAAGYVTFLDCLEGYLDGRLEGNELSALLIVHLCNLNRINTTAGYRTGHELRRVFARRIGSVLRGDDWMMPLTEDRLAVVLDRVRNAGHLMLAANRISRLAEGLQRNEPSGPTLETRVGAALFPEHGRSAEKLLRCAELAVELAALENAGNTLYRPEASKGVIDNWGTEAELRTALDRDEVAVVYQPKVDAATRAPCGAEALLRWQNPTLGEVAPAQFIPVAEACDQIDALTNFALHSAARDAAAWIALNSELAIAVNLSPAVIEQGDIVASFENAAAIWGIGLERFTAEVTENGIVSTAGAGLTVLAELRRAGVRVSIDDFGTGNSSLAYFRDIPADELKIDKSFVAVMLESETNTRLVQTIIDLAHGFGLRVVAEGVENAACADRLQALGCDTLQGYHFSKPLTQDEFLRYLAACRT